MTSGTPQPAPVPLVDEDTWLAHRRFTVHLLEQASVAARSGDRRTADGLLADAQDKVAQMRELLT